MMMDHEAHVSESNTATWLTKKTSPSKHAVAALSASFFIAGSNFSTTDRVVHHLHRSHRWLGPTWPAWAPNAQCEMSCQAVTATWSRRPYPKGPVLFSRGSGRSDLAIAGLPITTYWSLPSQFRPVISAYHLCGKIVDITNSLIPFHESFLDVGGKLCPCLAHR